jgi:hypothetical protein
MTEPSETFTNLVDAAKARVESYVNGERPHEEYLRPCLKAFLEWLPPGGQTSAARDIVNAGNDDQKLWQVDMAFVKTISPSHHTIILIILLTHCCLSVKEELNVYDIKVYGRVSNILTMLLQPNERKVKFQCSEGAENIPLPDPTFLDCHYRVAEIINGADLARPIGNKIRDWRDLRKYGDTNGCLRRDGSTDITDILNTALWPAVAE